MALLFSLVASLIVTSTGAANPPSRFTFTIDETFLATFTSAACGFDVFIHIEGTAAATLFFDRSGTLIREIDTSPDLKITFSAPSTGKSFTFPDAGTLTQDYSSGTGVGSPVLASLTGVLDGTGSTAGIPIIDFVSEISSSGHFNDDVLAARCAALSAP